MDKYMMVEEDPTEYRKSAEHYLVQLIGQAAYKKLTKFFGHSSYAIMAGRRDQYIGCGLTDKQADVLVAVRMLMHVKSDLNDRNKQIRCSLDCYNVVSHLSEYTVEHFLIVVLNRANKVLAVNTVSMGGTSGTVVDTKVLFSMVLACNSANSIILAHNHPSGNLSPSESDIELTKKIVEGAKLLDIKVLDHIIVSGQLTYGAKYLSFADEGYL